MTAFANYSWETRKDLSAECTLANDMSEAQDFPYITQLDIAFAPLEVVD